MTIQQTIFFIVRPVSAVRPSSVTDNLRGKYHAILDYDMPSWVNVTGNTELLYGDCGINKNAKQA